MCGISGFALKSEIDLGSYFRAHRALAHRGPDGQGFVISDERNADPEKLNTISFKNAEEHFSRRSRLCFGHHRLKIIDLTESGHQPFCSEDERYVLVYNGEIYNYIELREELRSYGYSFRSSSDTEVVLTAFQHWREKCFERFNGMWALAVLDTVDRQIFLCRDRFGIKPLYLTETRNGILFSSELKFFRMLNNELRLNADVAGNYIQKCLLDYNEETFFQGIHSLPAAHYLVFSTEGELLEKKRYWDLDLGDNIEMSLEEAAKQVRTLLLSSLTLRMRSDVSVGALLSGGLDSSSIVSLLCKYFDLEESRLNCFSAVYDEREFSEKDYIDDTIGRYEKIVPHFVYPSPANLKSDFEALLHAVETPFRSLSVYSQYCLYRHIKEASRVIVLLNGQGGDEIFGGYTAYFSAYLYELLSRSRLLPFFREFYYLRRHKKEDAWRDLAKAVNRVGRWPGIWGKLVSFRSRKSSLGQRLLNYDAASPGKNATSLNELLAYNLRVSALPEYLRYEDRNSMAFSLESRLPFLDYRLVEAAFRMGSSLKIRRGLSKAVLRSAVAGEVAPSILKRKDKMGFVSPQEVWQRTILKDWMKEVILTDEGSGIFRQREVEAGYNHYLEGSSNEEAFLWWRVFCFKYWYTSFLG